MKNLIHINIFLPNHEGSGCRPVTNFFILSLGHDNYVTFLHSNYDTVRVIEGFILVSYYNEVLIVLFCFVLFLLLDSLVISNNII